MTNDKCNVIYTHSRNFVSSVVRIDWVGWYEWNSQMQQCIKIWYMVFGGSDFDSLLHIILVVFMFGGSNQTFGKSQCYCVSTKHIFRFQPIWHYGVSVLPCYCVSFDYSVGLCQGVSLCYGVAHFQLLFWYFLVNGICAITLCKLLTLYCQPVLGGFGICQCYGVSPESMIIQFEIMLHIHM